MSITLPEYARATAIAVHGTLFQRLGMAHLGDVDAVGGAPGSVRGLTAVVTGPTAGIGRATAAALARRGAHVVLACRSAERGARLVAELEREHAARGLPPPSLEVRLLDLASLSSVRAFCEAFRASKGSGAVGGKANGGGSGKAAAAAAPPPPRPAHVLVCNAGVFNMGVRERRVTDEGGLEEHMACNHLGHFLLSVLMLPSLREGTRELKDKEEEEEARRKNNVNASAAAKGDDDGAADRDSNNSPLLPRARLVCVSSAMHHYGASLGRGADDRADPQLIQRTGAYSADRAYGRSKLAQLLFARELMRRVEGGDDLDVVALHPGMVVTDVVRSLPAAVGAAYRALMGRLLLSPDEGARASVFAATALAPVAPTGPSPSPSPSPCRQWYLDANALPVAPCAAAECPETAAWLWRWSAEVVGLKDEEDLPAREG